MALTLGPVIGTVGGDTWEETPVSVPGVGRLEYRTVTAPPPTTGGLVVVADLTVSVNSGSTAASVWIGDADTSLPIGQTTAAGILLPGEAVQVRGGNTLNTWSFTGTIYTMPLPD